MHNHINMRNVHNNIIMHKMHIIHNAYDFAYYAYYYAFYHAIMHNNMHDHIHLYE